MLSDTTVNALMVVGKHLSDRPLRVIGVKFNRAVGSGLPDVGLSPHEPE